MKFTLNILFVLLSITAFADLKLEITNEETPEGYLIIANNQEYCPVSVEVSFKMENLISSNGKQKVFVVPAQTKRFIITELKVNKPNKATQFNFYFKSTYGDVTQEKYEDTFPYHLPYQKGESYYISQGYNGTFSHQHENALDFEMPVGTELRAVREGVIVEVVDQNVKHCEDESCRKYNNYIVVYHSDGTFAAYSHLKKNGAKVKVGHQVKQGELIGLSGNVGWTSGPHLHLEIYLSRFSKRKTLETLFLIDEGKSPTSLKENQTYRRNY